MIASTNRRKEYCVIYRTGGTDNAKWHRTVPVPDHATAMIQRDEVMRMGYHAFVEDYRLSVSAGLPIGYKYVTPEAAK